jgi:dCMP deaminase
MNRVEYYLNIAKSVAAGSKCSRRKFGAIIVKDDAIVGTGYNGSARGTLNCGEDIPCIKDVAKEPHNISYDYCPAVHAEENAIINSDRMDRVGATMYLAPFMEGTGDRPCYKCRRKLLNAQIKDIWYIDKYGKIVHEEVSFYITLDNEWMYRKMRRAKSGL